MATSSRGTNFENAASATFIRQNSRDKAYRVTAKIRTKIRHTRAYRSNFGAAFATFFRDASGNALNGRRTNNRKTSPLKRRAYPIIQTAEIANKAATG